MCLRYVTKQLQKPSDKIIWAWKIFDLDESNDAYRLFFPFYGGDPEVQFSKWLKAKSPIVQTENGETYKAGFHAYLEKPEEFASGEIAIVHVKLRSCHTWGIQDTALKTVVADELWVPKPRKYPCRVIGD